MTTRALLRSLLPSAALALSIVACGNDTNAPSTRTMTVSLSSSTTDGAVLLTLTGPELPAPRPANPSFKVYWRLESSSKMRVAVFGTLSAGPLFTLSVPDGGQASAYAGTVLQVADRSNALPDAAGYGITVSADQQ